MTQDKYTKLARGKDCQVRIEGVCNFNPETTVLAHVRIIGVSGLGMKSPSILGAWACAACHQACDTGQYNGVHYEREFCELALLRGMARTQAALLKMGAL